MIEHTLHSYKQTCPRFKNYRIRLASALTTGIPLLLTFLVPVKAFSLFECPFLTITGLPCPFCGLTRSIWAISAGDWTFATLNYPLSWLLYAALVLMAAGNITSLLTGIKIKRLYFFPLTRNQANRSTAIIFSLILLNWLYRLSLGLT
ncbi:MAG: DUF2752 domain-containing protein [Desulfobacterales bacterium]